MMQTAPAQARRDVQARQNVKVRGDTGAPGARVYLHGFGCDQQVWRRLAPLVHTPGATVLCDHVGSGRSAVSAYDPRHYARLDAYARDVVDLLDAYDLRDAVLIGHSAGGMIALLAAIAAPERVRALVMIASTPRMLDEDADDGGLAGGRDGLPAACSAGGPAPARYRGGFAHGQLSSVLELMDGPATQWAGYMADLALGEHPAVLRDEFAQSLCFTPPQVARAFAQAAFFGDYREQAARWQGPALLLATRNDPFVPDEVSAYLHARMPGSELRWIETTGHCPHMSAPEATAAAIDDFLARLPARDDGGGTGWRHVRET